MKTNFHWLAVAFVVGAVGSVVVSSGCSTAPAPVPEVEEEQTEEYIQGEESYSKQQ